MAAKAIDIQPRKRKSKRIRAANKFLSNISLDGKVHSDKNETEITRAKQMPLPLDREEVRLISNQSFVQVPSLQAKPKLLTSFSTTAAVEENANLDITGSVSSTSTFHFKSSLEHACLYNRATSLTESIKHLYNNVVCTSGRNLAKYEVELCGKRVILCSGHHVPFAVYSTLKYTEQNKCSESLDKATYKLQRLSDEHGSYGIKGIDIGSKDMPVSYGHLLIRSCGDHQSSRNILSPRKNTNMSTSPKLEDSKSSVNAVCTSSGSSNPSKLLSSREYYLTSNYGDWKDYDPYLLDDPELRSGRHRKVLRLTSFMVSIIEYVKPSQLKKDLNEQFKEKFPHLEITLSKLRSLKHDLARLSRECCLDYSTVAYSIVYFEKLVLWGKINKANRKLVVGSCLLLAAKFNSDLRKEAIKQLIDHISDWFRVNSKDLLLFEIQALIALEFNLHILTGHVVPHLKRLEFESHTLMWK